MNTAISRRRRRTPDEWADIVRRSKTTDMPLKHFARAEGVSIPSLYAWQKRLEATGPAFARIAVAGAFTTASQTAPSPEHSCEPSAIEIEMADGYVVRLLPGKVDVAQLRAVLQVLGAVT